MNQVMNLYEKKPSNSFEISNTDIFLLLQSISNKMDHLQLFSESMDGKLNIFKQEVLDLRAEMRQNQKMQKELEKDLEDNKKVL